MAIFSTSGPSFAGKTYLISHILYDFDFKIVNFEKYFDISADIKDCYLMFFKEIAKLSESNHVVCESIYPINNNPFIKYKWNNIKNIICLPTYERHCINRKEFENKFGSKYVKRRTGGLTIESIRNNFKKWIPKDSIIWNGYNYNYVKEEIKNVISNG